MPDLIIEFRYVVVLSANSKVRIFVNVELKWLQGCHQHPLPNVELPQVTIPFLRPKALEQERSLYVLLNHFWSRRLLGKRVNDLILLVEAKDTQASSVVAGFAYPYVLIPIYIVVLRIVLGKVPVHLDR